MLLLLQVKQKMTFEHLSEFARSHCEMYSERGEVYIFSLLDREQLETLYTAVSSLSCYIHATNSGNLSDVPNYSSIFSTLLIIFRVITSSIRSWQILNKRQCDTMETDRDGEMVILM